jgi:hypothetical protein
MVLGTLPGQIAEFGRLVGLPSLSATRQGRSSSVRLILWSMM